MRDPGTARSNPLLGHETVEDPFEPSDGADDGAAHDGAAHDGAAHDRAAHDGAAHESAAHEFGAHASQAGGTDWKDPTSQPFPDDDWATLEDLLAPGSAGEAVVTSLLEAGPEALEHLTAAGHELLLAAKTMIDAAERGLAEYRRLQDEETDGSADLDEPDDPPANVTHLDAR